MLKTETILDFEGPITFETVEMLLTRLRSTQEFQSMRKPARKKLYGVFVESIENICKYAAGNSTDVKRKKRVPVVSVKKRGDKYIMTAGNMVANDHIEPLKFKLEMVNQLNKEALKTLYEDTIHQEFGSDDKGASLGLITIALRTENKLKYTFTTLDRYYSFFKIQITINE